MVPLILAAVSGTGKSTVGRALRQRNPALRLSVSHTTRAPRTGESDGVDYHFVERAAFKAMVEAGAFAEWAEYAGNLYGTAQSTLDAARQEGHDLFFDIEVQGAHQLKASVPEAISVFLLPPSWPVLVERLRNRRTESDASLQRRLETGRRELSAARSFDYLVVNDVLEAAVAEVEAIYRAAHARVEARRDTLEALIRRVGMTTAERSG